MITGFSWPMRFVAGVMAVAGGTGLFMALWLAGAVSRVKVRKPSPDGRLEAVCRARLPESTEYEIYLRRWWQPFGTYLAHSGTESMGRCRDVVWSPDGTLLLVVNEGDADRHDDSPFAGNVACTPNPPWGRGPARRWPPCRATRSRIPISPCPRPASGATPRPSSTTSTSSACGR